MAFTPGFERTLSVKVQSDGVGGFTGAMDSAIGSLGKFRTAVGLAGAALATMSAGALVSATSAASSFEEAMVEVEKVTDPQTAEAMTGAIRGMAREIPVAHEELANIAATAGRLGVEGEENIRSFTETVAKMAEATDLTSDQAADAFARMSTLMELPIDQTEELGSAINELSNNMAASSSEIVDAATRSSGVLTQLGLQSDEILALNGAMNEVSASSRIAGTQLRRFAQEIRDPGKVEDLSAALGMSVEEFKQMRKEDPSALIERMATTFGEGGDAADALRSTLSTTSRQTLSKLAQNWGSVEEGVAMANGEFENATSLQTEFDAATDTFNSKLQQMKNILRDNAIEIGNVLLPHLTRLLEGINEFLRSGDTLLGQLSAQQKAFGLIGTTVGGLAAALFFLAGGPITAVVGAVAALGAAYATNFMGMRDAVDELIGTLRTEFLPSMGEVRAAVDTGLAEARATWERHRDDVIADVRALFGGVRTVATTGIQNLATIVEDTLGRLRTFWKQHGDAIRNIVATSLGLVYAVVGDLLAGVFQLWNDHADGVFATVRRFVGMVQTTVLGLAGALIQIVQPLLERLRVFWSQHGEDVVFLLRMLAGAVITTIRTLANVAMGILRPFLALAGWLWEKFGDEVVAVISFAADAVFSTLGWLIETLVALIKAGSAVMAGDWDRAWSLIAGIFRSAATGIINFLKGWGTKLLGWLGGVVDGLKQAFVDFANWLILGSFIPKVFGKVLDFLGSLDLKGAITAPLDAFKSGISGAMDAAKQTFSNAKDAIEGIASTITSKASDAVSTAKSALSKARSMAKKAASAASNAGSRASSAASSVGSTISRHVPGLADGGVVTAPTLAMVGEGGQSEAVVPLDRLEAMMGGGSPSIGKVEVHANSEEGGRAAARGFEDELRSAGFRLG